MSVDEDETIGEGDSGDDEDGTGVDDGDGRGGEVRGGEVMDDVTGIAGGKKTSTM